MIKTSFFTRLLAFVVVFLSAGAVSVCAETDNPTLELLLNKVNQLRQDVRNMKSSDKNGGPVVDEQFTKDVADIRSGLTGSFAILLTPGIEQSQAAEALKSLKEIFEQLDAKLKKMPASLPTENPEAKPAKASMPLSMTAPAAAPEEAPAPTPAPEKAAAEEAAEEPSAPAAEAEMPAPEASAPAAETPASTPAEEDPAPAA